MKISIIIPVYNVEKYILRCVKSALNQESNDYEVIIVDDGSPDRSIEILNENISDERIKIIHQENAGLSSARNTGIKKAQGDYLWFVDSDDWIEKDCLTKIINKIDESRPDILYIYADEYVGENIYKRGEYKDFGIVTGKVYLDKFQKYNCAPFYIVRRDLLVKNKIQFYPGIFHEDNDYTPRLLYQAQRVTSIEGYFYHIFRHEGSITTTLKPKRLFDLIKIAQNYKNYITSIPKHDSHYFCRVIGNSINQAMFECSKYSIEIQKQVNKLISDGNYSKYLIKSGVVKYLFEGLLFTIFPNSCLKIYNILQKFNNDKGGQKSSRQLKEK